MARNNTAAVTDPEDEALDWSDLANIRAGEVERPKPLPLGHYRAIITGQAEQRVTKTKKKFYRFPVKLIEPLDDVDMEAFEQSSGFAANGYRLDFYLTKNAMYRFTNFGIAMGAPEDASIPEVQEHLATCGEMFTVEVKHQDDERDAENKFVQLDNPSVGD